jgi:Helix-turn-helix domain of transposase family ISL3
LGDAPPPIGAGCWLLEGQRLARRDGVRVTAAFSRLLNLAGVWVRQVRFEPDRVVVEVALKRRRLLCPLCEYSTASRKDTRPVDSVWRHVDLGIWRLEIHCRRRRLWCPQHGARSEGVPFARSGAEFTRDFECLVAWLATRTDKTTIKAMLRIDWDTVGRIVKRVCDDELDPGRLDGLFDIGIDEVSWKRQHNYLTLVADHLRGKIVWGTDARARRPPIASSKSSTRRSPHSRRQAQIREARAASRPSASALPSSGRSRWTWATGMPPPPASTRPRR